MFSYSSLFFPSLNYCVDIRGDSYPKNTNTIGLLQKIIIRIVFGARQIDHTN